MLVTVGWAGIHAASGAPTPAASAVSRTPPLAFAAAMVPVLFAYGGWQTASFVGGELRNPERDLLADSHRPTVGDTAPTRL